MPNNFRTELNFHFGRGTRFEYESFRITVEIQFEASKAVEARQGAVGRDVIGTDDFEVRRVAPVHGPTLDNG